MTHRTEKIIAAGQQQPRQHSGLRRHRRTVHHLGQFYAADQAELYLRLPHALGAERRAQLAAHPAHGRVHLCRYGHCPVGAFLPGRPAGRHCHADRTAGRRFGRQRVDLFVFVSGVYREDEVISENAM